MTGTRDALADLVLGSQCVGCTRPGRLLCSECRATLPAHAEVTWPSPPPTGLAVPFSAGAYDGLVKQLVLGHKEHRMLALAEPLAGLLSASVAGALSTLKAAGPVVVVPVPSRPQSVRSRGHDPTYSITSGAARLLRRRGYDVLALRLLRSRPGVVDQAGLGAADRAHNLGGSMACSADSLRRLAARRPRAHLVVCDDVLTTGATGREAQRALEAVGLPVLALAVVAATRLRHSSAPPGGP